MVNEIVDLLSFTEVKQMSIVMTADNVMRKGGIC